MKKIFMILLALMLIGSFAGISESSDAVQWEIGPFCFSLSSSWKLHEDTEDVNIHSITFWQDGSTSNVLNAINLSTDMPLTEDDDRELFFKSIVTSMGVTNAKGEMIEVNSESAYIYTGSFPDSSGQLAEVSGVICCHEDQILLLTYNSNETIKVKKMVIAKVADTITRSAPIDWGCMTDEELDAAIAAAQAELDSRHSTDSTLSPYINSEVYHVDKLSFSVSGVYLYEENEDKYVVVAFDWTNESDEPESFWAQLSIKAYQDGIEIEYDPPYGFDGNRMTHILPGYSTTSYNCYKLTNDNEVTVIIDDLIDLTDHFDDIYITVNPAELPAFEE